MSLAKIMSDVDDIKEKLTDNEYKTIVEEIVSVHNKNQAVIKTNDELKGELQELKLDLALTSGYFKWRYEEFQEETECTTKDWVNANANKHFDYPMCEQIKLYVKMQRMIEEAIRHQSGII